MNNSGTTQLRLVETVSITVEDVMTELLATHAPMDFGTIQLELPHVANTMMVTTKKTLFTFLMAALIVMLDTFVTKPNVFLVIIIHMVQMDVLCAKTMVIVLCVILLTSYSKNLIIPIPLALTVMNYLLVATNVQINILVPNVKMGFILSIFNIMELMDVQPI